MVSTFPQIDLKNSLALYAIQNGISLAEDDCWQLPSGARTGYASINDVTWLHQSVIKPTENQLITLHDNWVAANAALAASENTISTSQTSLKNKIALAEQFAPSIAAILNASLQQTEDATVQPTRFNNIKAVMDAQPAAFRNRFNGDLLQETGIVIAAILPLDYPNYCRYIRQWSTQLSLLLLARKAL